MNKRENPRIRIDPETKTYVEQIAEEHNCLYGGKPHIPELLEQIRLGKLIISKANLAPLKKVDDSVIGFRIEVPRYLAGAIAIISETIAKHQGNITSVTTKSRDNVGILHIFLALPPESSLSKVINDLQNLKNQQLKKFNEESDLKLIANKFESQLLFDRTKVITVDNFLSQNLICDMACVIGFQLIIEDQVGVLAKIAEQIAEAKLLIYSVNENAGHNVGEAIIKLFLYLRSTTKNSIPEQIIKIEGLIKQFKQIEQIKDVQRLGVDSLD